MRILLYGLIVVCSMFRGWLYAQNDYPIVLAHGLGGGEMILNIYPYWGGADEALRRSGSTVFVPSVTPYNSSYGRGEELAEKIRDFLIAQGARCEGELGTGQVNCTTKVHIIGHSQGGLDARHAAKWAGPGMVRSVLTVSTPNDGSCLTSELIALYGLGFDFLEFFANALGRVMYDPSRPGNRPIDARAAAQFLDPFDISCRLGDCAERADINVFNAEHPMEPGIDYFSVRAATLFPRVYLAPLGLLTGSCGGLSGRGILNDGIVEWSSQAYGHVLCYHAGGPGPACFDCRFCTDTLHVDHLDEVGVPLSLFNHHEFYRTAARWLQALPE